MSGDSEKKYLRMTLNERIQHFCLLSSFITLVITGFALKFPESLWVTAIFKLLGENAFELRSIIHRIAAVVMVSVSIYHLFYIIFANRGKQLVKDLWFQKTDITDLLSAFKYYTGRSKTRPRFGRFSYIEKAEYWAVVWGTVVMGGTGGVLWFENTFLPIISNSGMDIATAIHFYEAILASLAIFVWHFYFVIYNPDVYPMNKAWFKGYLTREEMELEHPLELEKFDDEEKQLELEQVEEKPELEIIEINKVIDEKLNNNGEKSQDILPDIKILNNIEKELKVENEKVVNPEVVNPEVVNPEVVNPEVVNPEVVNPEIEPEENLKGENEKVVNLEVESGGNLNQKKEKGY